MCRSQLLPDEIKKTIPRLYQTETLSPDQVTIPLKLFNPVGSSTWYITEIDEDCELAFGFCNLGDDEMAELGYVSISELESIQLPFGLSIERDLYWDTTTTLKDVMDFKVR